MDKTLANTTAESSVEQELVGIFRTTSTLTQPDEVLHWSYGGLGTAALDED